MSSDDENAGGMPPPPPPGSSRTPDWRGQEDWGADVAPTGPQPASVGTRAVAYIIDSILLGIVNFLLGLLIIAPFVAVDASGMATPFTGGALSAASIVASLIGAALTLAYFGFMEANNSGRTLGKMMLNIRATRANGEPLDLNDAVKRRLPFVLASLAGLIPFVGWIASIGIPIAILVTAVQDKPWNRGWHDHFAGTMVIQS